MTLPPDALYPWIGDDPPKTPAADPATVPSIVAAIPKLALSPKELAAAVGVSPSTISIWLRSGEAPPHVRLPGGRLIRFPVALAERWLAERATAGEPDASDIDPLAKAGGPAPEGIRP